MNIMLLTLETIEIVHRMNRQLVIRAGQCTRMKAKVVDEKDKVVGRLMKVFGPVSNPYGLVNLNEDVSESEGLRLLC